MLNAIALRSTLLLLSFLLLSFHLLPAAVDCRGPRNRQERVVCASPELLDLDLRLSSVFQKVLAIRPESKHKQLQYEQISREDSSGGCWDRIDCIKERYTERIAALRDRSCIWSQIDRLGYRTFAGVEQIDAPVNGGSKDDPQPNDPLF
jgi:uncharacterized protein